jgi:MinD-like ATPase involved in chromosome partitioning or flagellar assembly
MAQIIAMHSYRGGTGKSVIAANVAVLMARRGYRVALVDADMQAPALSVLLPAGLECRSLADFLLGRCEITEAVCEVPLDDTAGTLYLVPARSGVTDIDEMVQHGYDVGLLREGFDRLVAHLALDVLVVDTHAGINNETATSVGIADQLVIVTRADRLDLTGAGESIALANRLNCPRRAVVVNLAPEADMPTGIRADIEKLYGTKITAIVPYAPEMAALAGERLLVTAYPDHSVVDEYEEIIDAVVRFSRDLTEPGRDVRGSSGRRAPITP